MSIININKSCPSLLELTINICLNEWRKLFVNILASCNMKFPESKFFYGVIIKLKDKFMIRDAVGLCKCMLEVDSNSDIIEWLEILYTLNENQSNFFKYIDEICSKIPETKKLKLNDWISILSPNKNMSISIKWIYALRNRIICDNSLISFIENELKCDNSNDEIIDLVCIFELMNFERYIVEIYEHDFISLSDSEVKSYISNHLPTLRNSLKLFPSIANKFYQLFIDDKLCDNLSCLVCEIANLDEKYPTTRLCYDYVINHPNVIVNALKCDIITNIYDNISQKNKMIIFDKIMRLNFVKPSLIKIAFEIYPESLLNNLYNANNENHICKWIKQDNELILSGIIDPINLFTIDDFLQIVNKYWNELKEEIDPKIGSSSFRQLDGTIGYRADVKTIIINHIKNLKVDYVNVTIGSDKVVINDLSQCWMFDQIISQVYKAYENYQCERLSKIWNPMIEFLGQFSTITTKYFTQSGHPTSRSSITITNINLDILYKMHPKSVMHTLNSISKNTKDTLYWTREKDSFIEYYTPISKQIFDSLQKYSVGFNRLGLQIEDRALTRARIKFQKLEKAINRQISRKGTDYDRDVTWNNVINKEIDIIGNNRYRLTVIINHHEIIDNLSQLDISNQLNHLNEISYIYGGIDLNWKSSNFFVYYTPYRKISHNNIVNFKENLIKSGFNIDIQQITTNNSNDTEADDNIKIKYIWQATGIYNDYYYKPLTYQTPIAYVDESPIIPLDKTYSKQLIINLSNMISDKKLSSIVKSHINISLLRARTSKPDGKLSDSVVNELQTLIKSITNQNQIKEFKEKIKEIIPEYGC